MSNVENEYVINSDGLSRARMVEAPSEKAQEQIKEIIEEFAENGRADVHYAVSGVRKVNNNFSVASLKSTNSNLIDDVVLIQITVAVPYWEAGKGSSIDELRETLEADKKEAERIAKEAERKALLEKRVKLMEELASIDSKLK